MERFQNGQRICFVGDSITHNNTFLTYIVDYYRKNFPNEKIEFYNCGISGISLGNTIAEFDDDIPIYNPTHIVLMIGINDSGVYTLLEAPSVEKYGELERNFEKYKKNVEKFYEIVSSRGIKLILCTPVPYAEYQAGIADVKHGGYALMLGYSAFIKDFAREHNIALCDYNKDMTIAMQEETLYSSDGIHPNAVGHYFMAKSFLAAQGLALGDNRDFPEELREWHTKINKLRDIIATEYRIVPEYYNLPHDERHAIVKATDEEVKAGTREVSEYWKHLIATYLDNKGDQEELIKFIIDFMKN